MIQRALTNCFPALHQPIRCLREGQGVSRRIHLQIYTGFIGRSVANFEHTPQCGIVEKVEKNRSAIQCGSAHTIGIKKKCSVLSLLSFENEVCSESLFNRSRCTQRVCKNSMLQRDENRKTVEYDHFWKINCFFSPMSIRHSSHHISFLHRFRNDRSEYSAVEKMVASTGHVQLAHLMRLLRLDNPYLEESLPYKIWNEQAEINIPILILSSLYLDAFCKTNKKTQLFFSSRGCCHLFEIFKKLFPDYESHYFHTSRNVYKAPSPEYIQYVQSIYEHQKNVIVDEHGCGITCVNFFMKNFSVHPCYISITKFSGPNCGQSIVCPGSDKIERINWAQEGTLAGYTEKGPLRSPPEYDVSLLDPAYACVQRCLRILGGRCFGAYNQRLLEGLFRELDRRGAVLAEFHQPFHPQTVLDKAS